MRTNAVLALRPSQGSAVRGATCPEQRIPPAHSHRQRGSLARHSVCADAAFLPPKAGVCTQLRPAAASQVQQPCFNAEGDAWGGF